ncbi:MAG: HAD-IA family hydrolase [bacterium]
MLAGVDALIFDLDGVLWDSAAIHGESFRRTLEPFGVAVDYARIAGVRTDEAIARLLGEAGVAVDDELLRTLVARKRELARAHLRAAPPLAPRVAETLAALAARHRLALASAASRDAVEIFLDASHSRALFASVISGEDVRAAKPAPEIYLRSLSALDVPPGAVRVVEDSAAGIGAARAAGLAVIGCAGLLLPEELVALGAETVIDGVAELASSEPRRVVAIAELPDRPVRKERWTAIIPAAGRGSRLGLDRPKLLCPVLGRTALDWLVDAIEPVASRFVFVVAPAARAEVEPIVRARLGEAARVVEQPSPIGMADAVIRAEPEVRTPGALVVWGDQVLVRERTLGACVGAHERRLGALLTLPTVMRDDPYIRFERDTQGRLLRVRQQREGDPMGAGPGESDCGVFAFDAAALFSVLRELGDPAARGSRTGELNLLPLLPRFERGAGSVLAVRLDDVTESFGINTADDLALASAELRRRTSAAPP